MGLNILVAPDKFKGTASAQEVSEAVSRGWSSIRPHDRLTTMPITDGGDGFGEILAGLLGAAPRPVETVDAAGRPRTAHWWYQPERKLAIIEAARINGLALLPAKKFHPFELDTGGLGTVLIAAREAGAKSCLIGIGGSATNDGGFGMARALGWKFFDRKGIEITVWTGLADLHRIDKPKPLGLRVTVAVDVRNPLLGPKGCSRIYGPQKGLRPEDFPLAELALRRLARVLKKQFGIDHAKTPGAGAAGGLGFGLCAFLGAKVEPGFELFAQYGGLAKALKKADLVLSGEGAIDSSTLMGKGVGQLALLCRKSKIPCVAFCGVLLAKPSMTRRLFREVRPLVDLVSAERAKREPTVWLEKAAREAAMNWSCE
jgi:glycerate kinase